MHTTQETSCSLAYLRTIELLDGTKAPVIKAAPRGKRTVELLNHALVTFHNACSHFILVRGRDLNYAFGLVEAMQIIGGYTDLTQLSLYNSRMYQFSDNAVLKGAYGPRLRDAKLGDVTDGVKLDWAVAGAIKPNEKLDQLRAIILRLRQDPDSRQAVATVWCPGIDAVSMHHDKPCNVLLMFYLRQGHLHLTVVRRSSDVVLGVPYDHLCFNLLLNVMANSLRVEVGFLTQVAGSLHAYLDMYKSDWCLLRESASNPTAVINESTGNPKLDLDGFDAMIDSYLLVERAVRDGTYHTQSVITFVDGFAKTDEWWAHAMEVPLLYLLIARDQPGVTDEVLTRFKDLSPSWQRVHHGGWRRLLSKLEKTRARLDSALIDFSNHDDGGRDL